jgi:GLPGLI family protein
MWKDESTQMKKIGIIILCYFITSTLSAQYASNSRDAARKVSIGQYNYSIIYNYRYAIDTISNKRFLDRKILEIGNDFSRFYSMYADRVDSVMHRARIDKKNKTGGLNPRTWMKSDEKDIYEDYYINYPKKGILMVRTALIDTEYEYQEPINQFEWQIIADQSETILGYECIKATTSFRGRKFEVWFTLSIPISLGPWKFSGLPGLILKAKDTNGLFTWEAMGMTQTKGDIYIYDPKGGTSIPGAPSMRIVKISRAQLQKLQRKLWEDPVGLSMQHGGTVTAMDLLTKKLTPLKPGDMRYPFIPPLELE